MIPPTRASIKERRFRFSLSTTYREAFLEAARPSRAASCVYPESRPSPEKGKKIAEQGGNKTRSARNTMNTKERPEKTRARMNAWRLLMAAVGFLLALGPVCAVAQNAAQRAALSRMIASPASGVEATSVPLTRPGGLVFDAAGNLFIADTDHQRAARPTGKRQKQDTFGGNWPLQEN